MAEELRLISFGYLHAAPPSADRIVDVRGRLRDPAGYHQILAMLEQGPVDGRQPPVRDIVLRTPGADELLDELAAFVTADGVASVAVGCSQGHDRSVAVVELLAERARAAGRTVVVEHRHVDLPRVR
jgi:UPF0042 nucleotide-binding protein